MHFLRKSSEKNVDRQQQGGGAEQSRQLVQELVQVLVQLVLVLVLVLIL